MATVEQEKAPLTARLGDNPELKKVKAKLADGPPRPRQQQQQRREKQPVAQAQNSGWRVQPTQQQQQQQPTQQAPVQQAPADLQDQLQAAQLQLQLRQIQQQLNPEEPVPLWHKFLYSFGMLFATRVVDKVLERPPVWRRHKGKFVAGGVLAAFAGAFLFWKATRPLE